jgi:hypothetical protein
MAFGKFSQATRDAIVKRANGRCEICGMRIENRQVHHRQPRGMGGSRGAEISSASNGLLLDPLCHSMVEGDRKRAYMMGWLVRRGIQPHSREVLLWDGWFVLTADGGRLPLEPDG